MSYLFTSESVSEGHPDKVADQISDSLLDEFLRQDTESKVAVETLVTTGLVVVAGEVHTNGYVDVQGTVRNTIRDIGYTKAEYQFECESCGILSAIHEQSPDIYQGVVRQNAEDQGAGDQGMMFGYACRETEYYMPVSIELAHRLLQELAAIRREGKVMTYLRPDAKSQVTMEYNDDRTPARIHTIVVSTQHDPEICDAGGCEKIRQDIINILIPRIIANTEGQMKLLLQDYLQDLVTRHASRVTNALFYYITAGAAGSLGSPALASGSLTSR
jgi:S-adenosylmethionine synthetase